MTLVRDCFNKNCFFFYHFNVVPRMELSVSLSFYHQAPNLAQISRSEVHNVAINFKILIILFPLI